MSRITKILTRVRDTLADHKKERWSDERLLRLLDSAQKDICRRAKLLRTKVSYVVLDGKYEYIMPKDFLLLDKVMINKEPIPLIGHTELDSSVSKWEERRGKVSNVVYDKQERGKIRLYPIPAYDNHNRFKSVPAYNTYFRGKVRDRYGVLGDIAKPGGMPNGVFGVTTKITSIFQWIEEDIGIPKVVVRDYKLINPYGIATGIFLHMVKGEMDSNVGEVVSVSGAKVEEFGVLSSAEKNEGYNLYFSDTFGEGTAFQVVNKAGFFTDFKTRGEISDVCNGKLINSLGFVSEVHFDNKENVTFSSPYGLATELVKTSNIMEVFYLRKPADINTVFDEIEIDECFDTAIKHYVCGMAFRDDLDTQNRTMGAEELNLYERDLQEAVNDDVTDFVRGARTTLTPRYNGGLNE